MIAHLRLQLLFLFIYFFFRGQVMVGARFLWTAQAREQYCEASLARIFSCFFQLACLPTLCKGSILKSLANTMIIYKYYFTTVQYLLCSLIWFVLSNKGRKAPRYSLFIYVKLEKVLLFPKVMCYVLLTIDKHPFGNQNYLPNK